MLRVVVVHPDLLGTYGDGGNATVLVKRAQWRGIDAELVQAPSHSRLPEGEIYCLGGGEDGPQERSAQILREEGVLKSMVDDGAVLLAVCAGFQIAGNEFPGAGGIAARGLGIFDAITTKGAGRRAVGEVLVEPLDGIDIPLLTGFENHRGATRLGRGTRALGRVVHGVGNSREGRSEGAMGERAIGTYLHGPVLARNPGVADILLTWALGDSSRELITPIDDREVEILREERIGSFRGKWTRRLRRNEDAYR